MTRLLVVAAMLGLLSCGDDDENGDGATETTVEDGGSEPTGDAITITDYTDEEISLDAPAVRVACLYAACIDALAELDMVPVTLPGPPDSEVASRPEYFGDDAADIPQLGGDFFEPDLEDIAAAEPDLVIGAACFHDGLREALEPIAPLLLFDLGDYELAMENLRLIGDATAKEDEAEAAVEDLRAKIDAYAAMSPGTLVPLPIYPTTEAPLIDSTSSQAGTVLAEVGPYPWPAFEGDSCLGGGQVTYSLEKVLEIDPDVMFVITSPGSDLSITDFESNPVWSQLKAVANGRVHPVVSSIWSIGGTRSAGLMLDEAMTLMYPEVFPEPRD